MFFLCHTVLFRSNFFHRVYGQNSKQEVSAYAVAARLHRISVGKASWPVGLPRSLENKPTCCVETFQMYTYKSVWGCECTKVNVHKGNICTRVYLSV